MGTPKLEHIAAADLFDSFPFGLLGDLLEHLELSHVQGVSREVHELLDQDAEDDVIVLDFLLAAQKRVKAVFALSQKLQTSQFVNLFETMRK